MSNKRTFIFVNIGGDWEGIAQRVKAEGHQVYNYRTKDQVKGRENTDEGIFTPKERIDDLFEILNKFMDKKEEVIILFDDNGYGDECDYLRSEGWKVIGGAAFADKIEYDRAFGLNVMKGIGLNLPDEKTFSTIDEGIRFLEGEDEDVRFVFKPDGEVFAGSSKTYLGKNRQDLIDYLKWIKADCIERHYTITKFVLQEFVEGIEADFAAYFNGEEFMPGCILDIEEKKSGDGNKGEATGCMGNIIIFFDSCKYFDKYIQKLTPALKAKKYVGQISINNIFAKGSKDGKYKAGVPYGLEFTPRFGWDSQTTEMSIHKASKQNVSDFYIALAERGEFKFNSKLVGCGVRVYTGSINLKREDVSGRFFSFDPSVKDNLWFYSVSFKNNSTVIEDNPVLMANAVKPNLKASITDCYDNVLAKLNVPDVYYRMEIGKRAEEVIRFLNKHGWI